MVVPVGGDPLLMGPPPDSVLPRLRRIKVCLVAMLFALVAKLTGQILLQPKLALGITLDSLATVLVAVVGVFLLKDDPCFGKVHACLLRLCCTGCEESCPGGVSCLCTWFAVCLITALSDLLGDVQTVYVGCRLIFDPSFPDKYEWHFTPRTTPWLVCMVVYLTGLSVALVSQIVGAWQGMKGCVESQAAAADALEGGDWGADPRLGPGGLYGPQAMPQPSAPPAQGAPGNTQAPGNSQRPPPGRGFQAFSGQGQRLGD
mmetsp:Transcript_24346/g.72565  ORF Transcript_24346/g.72565 Transcript_24346/m.72565 type:complete len:259 (-) Transcript_24346:32-808(-)